MNRIVNAIKLEKFSRRNLVMGLLGGVLVAAIIFLPEIISWVGKKQTVVRSNAGLDDIFASLKPDSSIPASRQSYNEPAGRTVSRIEPGDGWSDDPAYDLPSRPRLNRDQHRANISRARQESLLLAKKLGVDGVQTKFALFDFANSLGLVLAGTAELFSGNEAYDYIMDARTRVVQYIRDEKVNRELVRPWNSASISAVDAVDFLKCDVAETKASVKAEQKIALPSDPTLKREIKPMPMILTKLKRYPDGKKVELYGHLPTKAAIRRIDIFAGGAKAPGIVYLHPSDPNGIGFYYRTKDGVPVHTMRVVFENGDYFEKEFKFWGEGGPAPALDPNAPIMLTSNKKGATEKKPVFKEL